MAHYLDDYITMGPPSSAVCQKNLDVMLTLCRRLGVPVAPANCEGISTVLVYLGFELDTDNLVVRLPQAKLQLESLFGHLHHVATVVRPGCTFVHRLIELVGAFQRDNHWIRMNSSTRSDIHGG